MVDFVERVDEQGEWVVVVGLGLDVWCDVFEDVIVGDEEFFFLVVE